MLWDEHSAKGEAAKRKVLKIGKTVIKPGARQGKTEQVEQRDAKLRDQQRKSTGAVSMNIAADRIANRLGR